MKIELNQGLDKYTTIRIGGVAKKILIPETIDELNDLILKESPKYFIGGGSNLLIANHEFDLVICLREFNKNFEYVTDGVFKVGASLRLQQLINKINEEGYGGIEYLYSVPGLVGGAIVMNAGRGRKYNQSISDYIISVDVLENGKIITIKKEECEFSYRKSIFKNSSSIVVGCTFKFPKVDKLESEKRKLDRLELCKRLQDTSKPNFGTVFCESNNFIMGIAKKMKIGNKVHFSGKTQNWLLNDGGNFEDAISSIKKVELIHKLLFKKIDREVIIWK